MKTLLSLLFLWGLTSFGQETVTVKYFGLTIHPFGDRTAALQPNKLDKNARFVVNMGAFVGYEKYFYEDLFSVKIIQGVFTDCSNGLAVLTHIGPRVALMKTEKHRVYFGIGPTLLVRDSWRRFGDDYEPSGYFNETYSKRLGDLQWKFIPYAFEIEYDYAFTNQNQLSFSFTPAVPLAGIFSIGWKHWFHWKAYDNDVKVYVPKKR